MTVAKLVDEPKHSSAPNLMVESNGTKLFELRVDLTIAHLRHWAASEKVFQKRGHYHMGFAVGHLITQAINPRQPQAFLLRYRAGRPFVLFYSRNNLQEIATSQAPELARVKDLLHWDTASERTILVDENLTQVNFLCRFRPQVTVMAKNDGITKLPPERRVDAYYVTKIDQGIERATAYKSWLAARISKAARIDAFELLEFPELKLRVLQNDGKVIIERAADAWARGLLKISEPDAFSNLLISGIGDHVPFGIGLIQIETACP